MFSLQHQILLLHCVNILNSCGVRNRNLCTLEEKGLEQSTEMNLPAVSTLLYNVELFYKTSNLKIFWITSWWKLTFMAWTKLSNIFSWRSYWAPFRQIKALWAPFFQIKTRWAPFLLVFSRSFLRFSGILQRFSQILPRFSPNQNFLGCTCTPTSYTTASWCLSFFILNVCHVSIIFCQPRLSSQLFWLTNCPRWNIIRDNSREHRFFFRWICERILTYVSTLCLYPRSFEMQLMSNDHQGFPIC